jgi:sarcosine oxidase subunit gamma
VSASNNPIRISALSRLCREPDEIKPLPPPQGEGRDGGGLSQWKNRTPTLALPLEGGGNVIRGSKPAPSSLAISERRDLTMINLRGRAEHGGGFLASANEQLLAALPLTPNSSTACADGLVLNLGPDEWLLVGARFSEDLKVSGGFLTDVSHGRSCVRIGGPQARELLAKGCSLDLDARVFKPGQCAQTSIARVSVLLHLRESAQFDLYCARSYARTLWHWLTEASAEFGYRVEVEQP